MTSAAAAPPYDRTETPFIVRMSVVLGIVQTLVVVGFSYATRLFDGPLEKGLEIALLVVGLAATVLLPGVWTRARSIEGIAGAAGIGLGAAVVFLLFDVSLLQPLHMYTFRWRAIGGGSNWWYNPVWWMAGTYLAWMGAFIQANQVERRGEASVAGVVLLTVILSAIFGVAAIALHVPGAAWSIPTFGVAVLPALAAGSIATSFGARRSGA